MNAGKEISGGFFVAGGDGPEVFDDVEEALDEVAFPVKREIAVAFGLAIGFRRDDRRDGADLKALDEGVRVISFVGEQGLRLDLRGQRLGLLDVMGLAAGQADNKRIAQRIDDGVDLGRQPAARAAYGFSAPPFLRAPALC